MRRGDILPAARRLLSPKVVLMLLVLTGCCAMALWPKVKDGLGLADHGRWFLDSYAILASSDAVQAGIDPSRANPLDVFHRPHSYSGWWFLLGDIGLTRADNFAVGGAWLLLFFAAAFGLLRPENYSESGWAALCLLSPPVLLAVLRANNDLVIFALLGFGLAGLRPDSRWRLGMFCLGVVFATGLKFYPLVAGAGLFVIGPPRLRWWALGVTVVAGGLVLASQWEYFQRAVFPPVPVAVYTFGAAVWWRELGATGAWITVVSGLLLFVGARICCRRGWSAGLASGPGLLGERTAFAVGAVLLIVCWLLGISFGYRWIFALLLLPWLWRRQQVVEGRLMARVAIGLLLVGLWVDGLFCLVMNVFILPQAEPVVQSLQHYWLLFTQPFTWALMALLAGWLWELMVVRAVEVAAAWPAGWRMSPRLLLGAVLGAGLLGLTLSDRGRAALGLTDHGRWFLDSYAVLAASDAHRDGLDAADANPYDPLNRPHRYSDWWYALGGAGLGRADNFAVGLAWVVAFLAAAWLTVRPRDWKEAAWIAAVLLSPSVFQGILRANNDLVVFAVLALAVWALRVPTPVRLGLAAAAAGLATGLKFYPVVVVGAFLLLRPVRLAVKGTVAAGLVAGAVLASVASQLSRGMFPVEVSVHVWGGRIWLQDLGVPDDWQAMLLGVAVTATAAIAGWWGWRAKNPDEKNESLSDECMFAVAALLMLACFLAGMNYAYRWIFALWLGPWLWSMAYASPAASPRAKSVARFAWGLVPVVLWLDGIFCLMVNLGGSGLVPADYAAAQHWWRLMTQPLTWLLMALLGGALLRLLALAWARSRA